MPEIENETYADRPSTFPWPPLLWLSAIAVAWAAGQLFPLPWPGLDDFAARAVGLAFGAVGIALMVWGIVTLHRAGTTVRPDQGSDVLVTSGPFWRFRNPIYLAQVLIMLGLAEVGKNAWFVFFAFVHAILVTKLAIIPEERHLESRFGDLYRTYKARSRRWI